MSHSKIPYLELKKIDKFFGVTKALQEMDLSVYLGEIVGLVGPNGAGKSTLIKVITGAHAPTNGQIIFEGTKVMDDGYGPQRAKNYGINCAYQELSLCTNLPVYENFMLNHMDHSPFGKPGWRTEAKRLVREKLNEIFPNNGIDINSRVGKLPLAQRQMVEIARAASYKDLKVLLLDEPTSSLTSDCIGQLHEAMQKLAAKGIAIIYITHKLNEIYRICDRIVVMKGGHTELAGNRSDIPLETLMDVLGGQAESVRADVRNDDIENQEVLANVKGLNTSVLKNVEFQVHKCEIIGISGLAGAGQKELLLEIFKASRKKRNSNGPIDLNTKVAYISGDRQEEGIFPLWDIADNINVSSLNKICRKGIVISKRFRELAQKWYDKFSFTAEGINADITSLSGGNQQKTLIARGLATEADLILLNDPTCGVDVQTKGEIYRLLSEAKKQNKAVIWNSTEDYEMEQCDTVYVMHEGEISKKLTGSEVSVNNIIRASFTEQLKENADVKEEKKQGPGLLRKVVSHGAFLAIATLLIIFTINASLRPNILSYNGIRLLFSSAVPLIFIAIGQMFIVISGGIDMGNMMALALVNAITAYMLASDPALSVLLYAAIIIGYALLGSIIYFTGIPAIIVTLGASYIWQGFALFVAPIPGGSCPVWLRAFFTFKFPLIPMPILLAIVAAAISFWIVKKSKYGMVINGLGNNPAAVSRAGWSKLRATMVVYALSGFFVVLAGLMLTAVANSADVTSTASYQMLSIATIIMGGCEFTGGISEPVGVVAGALAISIISALLTFIGIDSNFQSAVTGVILIVSLAIRLISKKMERK